MRCPHILRPWTAVIVVSIGCCTTLFPSTTTTSAFSPATLVRHPQQPYHHAPHPLVRARRRPWALHVATSSSSDVAKTGGRGDISTSQLTYDRNLNLGSPQGRPIAGRHTTRGGVTITSTMTPVPYSRVATHDGADHSAARLEALIDRLDDHKGVLLSSSYEFPGRYKRWSLGFVDPPLEIAGSGQRCVVRALNARGLALLPAVRHAMVALDAVGGVLADVDVTDETSVTVHVVAGSEVGSFNEEDRSRQPSLFSVVRALVDTFGFDTHGDQQLGLYGAFGYDLTFQFEPVEIKQRRDEEQRDLLLYLPDEILVIDQDRNDAWIQSYDFEYQGVSTQGMARDAQFQPPVPFQSYEQHHPNKDEVFLERDTPPNEFSSSVTRAKEEFKVGNLFEVVLSQTFRHRLDAKTLPSTLFRRLRARNPSPYGFLINLGEDEYLVGASPEMFVRCQHTTLDDDDDANLDNSGIRVETCPISGTVARGADALEDARRVKSLLVNAKEESELTMCTDVDRNDKSRICVPGSVKVIGRRQIEMYSRLIHTVDHVEGYLRRGFDALDAFLCHTWAVTVTGAPKTWAIQFVEDMERSPRCWYGGAVGMVGFDGGLNTGLTLRTVRVKNGVAEVRAGATLLYDSDPTDEELETELKASAMIDAIVRSGDDDVSATTTTAATPQQHDKVGRNKKIVLIDHEDSFVHTLGNYLRQTGAEVVTLRSGPKALAALATMRPDMVVLSPGPGNPRDFGLSQTLEVLTRLKIPAFGVCLGLQGMVEHFGGTLGVLGYPMHGKPSGVSLTEAGSSSPTSIFKDLPNSFEVARYHSLYGLEESLPEELVVTARSEDGIVMGIQHATLPYAAVQFHPESILTSPKHGMTILENAMTFLSYADEEN